jgi:hypothetical protein
MENVPSEHEHPIRDLVHTESRSVKRRLALEVVIIGSLYAIYTIIRNTNEASETKAFEHAKSVMKFQDAININIEKGMQEFFINFEWLIIASNYFYGSLHFIATIFALVYVFAKDSRRYSVVRNTIVISTGIALVGFLTYPLMPPRLLPESYGYIDTLAKYPTFWSFNSEEFAAISNQFAAMPSVHVIWATWVCFALFPYAKNRLQQAALIAYPSITVFVIIVTANHYLLDAIVAWMILIFAYWVSRMISSFTTRSAMDKTASLAEMSAK